MGDTIEITAWPKHQHIFYRFTNSSICFDVKAPGNALLGLARKPGDKCDFWICIGDGYVTRSWIRKQYGRSHSVPTPRILSQDEYKSFWLTWFGDSIKLGRRGEEKPMISYSKHESDLKFITFSVLGERNAVNYRFDVPPQYMEPVTLKPLSDGKPQWVDADLQLPDGAVIGGFENETLYIVRAHHRGSLTPGKFVPSEGVAYISWGGHAHEKSQFQVLCGIDYMWASTSENRIPVGAIEGGHSEDGLERLFIGRAFHEGHLIPGKVQPSHKVCYIPFRGTEIGKKIFEILVHPLLNNQHAHKFYIPEMNVPEFSESEGSNDSDHNDNDDDEEYGYNNDHEDIDFAVAF